jgi:hypothetical protein
MAQKAQNPHVSQCISCPKPSERVREKPGNKRAVVLITKNYLALQLTASIILLKMKLHLYLRNFFI